MRDYKKEPLKLREYPTEEELRELYLNRNMTQAELCELFGRSDVWLCEQFRKYGIQKSYQQALIRQRETNLKKYGVENAMQSKVVREKAIQTNLKRYGVEIPQRLESIKTKARNTMIARYGYATRNSDPLLKDEITKKRIKTCMEKYGRTNVTQIQLESTTYDILLDKEKYTAFILSQENKTPIALADKLKISSDRVLRRCKMYGIENLLDLHTNTSHYEKEIASLFPTISFVRTKKVIAPYEIDLYSEKYKVGIEFNGDYWHNAEHIKDKYYYQKKSLLAREKGIFIYHIFEYEWSNAKLRQKIINQLNNIFGLNSHKIYARKCDIRIVTKDEKKVFLEANHLQGNDNATVLLGLYYNDELVSLMTFCKPRFNKHFDWELSRFCSKSDCNVIGGASKLFKYFIDNYSGDIISYSDLTKTRGTLYEKLGFKFDGINKPQYHWVRGSVVLSRYQTRIENEISTLQSKDFNKVFDCGTIRWVYKRSI